MALYKYRALDVEGKPVEGTIEESSAHRVTKVLQERGLTVNTVEELHRERGLLRVSKRLSWDELNVLTDQLVSVARSELPLAPAVKALAADLRSSRLKPVLDQLHKDLEQGVSLEDAITRQHASFPKLFPSVIRAGEKTSNLAGVLQLLCNYTTRMIGVKHTLQLAMAYPVMVLLIGSCVMGFLLVKVVPVFADIFHDFGGQLPWPTQFWVDMGDFMVHRWQAVVVGIAAGYIAARLLRAYLARTQSGSAWLDWLRMHMPVLGHMHYLMAMARFSRTLGMLLASRVPIIESLELAAASSDSPLLQQAVEEASLQVAGGERIADSLSGTGFFGHNFCWLLSTGEERGRAEDALENLANTYDREIATRDKLVGTMAAPIMVLLLGGIIVSLLVSLYLPIFTLGDVISGS